MRRQRRERVGSGRCSGGVQGSKLSKQVLRCCFQASQRRAASSSDCLVRQLLPKLHESSSRKMLSFAVGSFSLVVQPGLAPSRAVGCAQPVRLSPPRAGLFDMFKESVSEKAQTLWPSRMQCTTCHRCIHFRRRIRHARRRSSRPSRTWRRCGVTPRRWQSTRKRCRVRVRARGIG